MLCPLLMLFWIITISNGRIYRCYFNKNTSLRSISELYNFGKESGTFQYLKCKCSKDESIAAGIPKQQIITSTFGSVLQFKLTINV